MGEQEYSEQLAVFVERFDKIRAEFSVIADDIENWAETNADSFTREQNKDAIRLMLVAELIAEHLL